MNMKNSILIAAVVCLISSGALAASTPWSSTEGGKLRLIALPPASNGSVEAVLEIVPDAGWHTYWKVPGSGGIPPQLSLKDGGNITLQSVSFPPPQIFENGNLRDYGYDSTVRLPLSLKQEQAGQPSSIEASVFVGLCAQVCVPFQTSLSLKLNPEDKATSVETVQVRAAKALLPEAPGEDFKVLDARLSADGKSVTATVKLPPGADIDSSSFIVTTADGVAFKKPDVAASSDGLATISASPVFLEDGKTLKGRPLDLLVKAAGRAMETPLNPQ
jgi:DsbC/DsbD-like thiol-disulfide interchange protein